jgi:copper chaperone CopZ
MKKISFNMSKDVCDDCSLALRRFIGNMKGVESINVEEGKVVIDFDDLKISKEELDRITRDSIEKLGYKLRD